MVEHEWPRVDAFVCTRNRPELLARAVASVWAQRYDGPIHLVVVLDSPESETPEPELPPPPPGRTLSVVRNQGTPGLAGARNDGLARVGADLLATIDDDDEWHPDRVRRQVELLEQDPALVGAGGGTCIVQASSRTDRLPQFERVGHEQLLSDRIAYLHPSTFLLRTPAVREAGGWDETIPGGYAEDYDFLLRLTRLGSIGLVQDVVTDVHWAGQSYFFSRWAQIAEALTYLLDLHPDFEQSPRGHARILGQIAFARAASGDRRGAWRAIRRGVRLHPSEPRFTLASMVVLHLVTADRIQRILHARGRGV